MFEFFEVFDEVLGFGIVGFVVDLNWCNVEVVEVV